MWVNINLTVVKGVNTIIQNEFDYEKEIVTTIKE